MVSHLCAHIILNVRVDSNHNPALTSAITTIDLDFDTAIRILSPPYLSDSLHLGRFTIIRTFHSNIKTTLRTPSADIASNSTRCASTSYQTL